MKHHETEQPAAADTAAALIASPYFRTYQEAVMEQREELARKAGRGQIDLARIRLPYQPQIPSEDQADQESHGD